jgi:hypothetical protein
MHGAMTYQMRFRCFRLDCQQEFHVDCGAHPDAAYAKKQAIAHGWRVRQGLWACAEHARPRNIEVLEAATKQMAKTFDPDDYPLY